MKLVHFVAAAAVALAPAAASAAPDAGSAATEAQADTVLIPFDPPLDRKLTYRIRKVEQKETGTNETSLDISVEFSVEADRYRMTVIHILPPEVRDSAHPGLALLQRPLAFMIDRNGEVLGLEDEDTYWSDVAKGIQALAGAQADPQSRAMADRIVEQMRNLPDEERLWLAGQYILPIVELAGVELARGDPVEFSEDVEGILGPLVHTTRLSLDKIEGESAFVSTVTAISPEQIEVMAEQLAGFAPDRPKEAEEGELAGVETRKSFVVSLATGLVSRFQSTRTAEGIENGVAVSHVETQSLDLIP